MLDRKCLHSLLVVALLAAAACSGSSDPQSNGGDDGRGPSRGAIDAAASPIAGDTGPSGAGGATVSGGSGGGGGGGTTTGSGGDTLAPDGGIGSGGAIASDGGSGGDETTCQNQPTYTAPLIIFAGGPNFGSGAAVGLCGFPNDKLPKDRFYGALDGALFAQAQACGACVRIESMDGKVTADVQIIDRVDPLLPLGGHFVSADAEVHGRFPGNNPDVRFHFVPCDVQGNIQVQFDATTTTGSSLLVMNQRTALTGVQVSTTAGWKPLARTLFNRWPIPFAINDKKNGLRFIDTNGRMVDAPDISFTGELQDSHAQFPACAKNPGTPMPMPR